MPRLRHILFWVANALSLLVCGLTVVSFGGRDPRSLFDLYSPVSYFWKPLAGELQFERSDVAYLVYRYEPPAAVDKGPAPPWTPENYQWMSRVRARDTAIFFLGFHHDKRAHFESNYLDGYEYTVGVRYATALLLSEILPIIALSKLVRWRRARRAMKMGLCPACGYDLRASSGRCPECGRQITATP